MTVTPSERKLEKLPDRKGEAAHSSGLCELSIEMFEHGLERFMPGRRANAVVPFRIRRW
jgi:hypothetical protein